MIPTAPDGKKHNSSRSGGDLLTLRAFVLLIIAVGTGLLWVHNPKWGGAVLAALTVLAVLAKMIGS